MANRFVRNIQSIFYSFYASSAWRLLIGIYTFALVGGLGLSLVQQTSVEQTLVAEVTTTQEAVDNLSDIAAQYEQLKNEDQVMRNASLSAEIKAIGETYEDGSQLFEQRADLAVTGAKTRDIDLALASFLSLLGKKDYTAARLQITAVQKLIDKVIADSVPKPPSAPSVAQAPVNNTAPGSGYSRQKVSTSRGEFVISMYVAPGARAVVETASDSDCADNCPTKSLAEHIAASGGFAGINGAYFCPPDYPRCQGKVNSFDTLAVNGRTKAVLNRANNVYSVVPLAAMYGTNISFYDQTVQWGVDTSGGGAIANYPRLVRDGSAATTEENGKGTRGFIGTKDGAIVIGHVFAASFGDTAEVLRTLGLNNALNLDGGGSSALWSDGGYKTGPGRSLPTAIVLVR